jgi:hypothetical protein
MAAADAQASSGFHVLDALDDEATFSFLQM